MATLNVMYLLKLTVLLDNFFSTVGVKKINKRDKAVYYHLLLRRIDRVSLMYIEVRIIKSETN